MIYVGECLPMFSSRSFIVSGLTFRSLVHFEFIFVYGVRRCSSFILLQEVDQFSQHHLLKRLSFSHCISLARRILNHWITREALDKYLLHKGLILNSFPLNLCVTFRRTFSDSAYSMVICTQTWYFFPLQNFPGLAFAWCLSIYPYSSLDNKFREPRGSGLLVLLSLGFSTKSLNIVLGAKYFLKL